MARNDFRLRGALGGVIAADEDLRREQKEKLDNINLAARAVDAVDKIRRNRRFSAKEREMDLQLKKEELVKRVHKNAIDEEFERDDREIAQDTARSTSTIKGVEADVADKFGMKQAEQGLQKGETDIRRNEAEIDAIPKRLALQASQVGVARDRNKVARERLQFDKDLHDDKQPYRDAQTQLTEATAKKIELLNEIREIRDPRDLVAAEEALEKATTAELKASAALKNAQAKNGGFSPGSRSKTVIASGADRQMAEDLLIDLSKSLGLELGTETVNGETIIPVMEQAVGPLAQKIAGIKSRGGLSPEEVGKEAIKEMLAEGRLMGVSPWYSDTPNQLTYLPETDENAVTMNWFTNMLDKFAPKLDGTGGDPEKIAILVSKWNQHNNYIPRYIVDQYPFLREYIQ